ncbi:MAG: hypothetical protein WD359_02365 [Dehalococcoidia bacterium]
MTTTPPQDNPAVARLKAEIAKDRARLSEQLERMDLDDGPVAPATGTTTGRLSRVFALMSA